MSSQSSFAGPDVEILTWPDDAERLQILRVAAIPRLVLVPPAEAAPILDDELEDWVRVPADDHEVLLRCRRLARLAREGVHKLSLPRTDTQSEVTPPESTQELRVR